MCLVSVCAVVYHSVDTGLICEEGKAVVGCCIKVEERKETSNKYSKYLVLADNIISDIILLKMHTFVN